jgi:hypothetical protein
MMTAEAPVTWMTFRYRDHSQRLECFYCHMTLNDGDRITSKHGQPQCEMCFVWEHAAPPPPALAVEIAPSLADHRDDAIKALRRILKARSGKEWRITGGRGTAYGWITINAPKSRAADEYGGLTPADRAELAKLLDNDRPTHPQGESIPAGHDYRREYLDRAAGHRARVIGQQYWD